jgi:hypothetical protein
MSVKDNEAIYDERIDPLMKQIISICKEHGIPMAATFEYAPEDFCTTLIPAEGQSDAMRDINRTMSRFVRTGSTVPPLQITTTKADGSKIVEVVIP